MIKDNEMETTIEETENYNRELLSAFERSLKAKDLSDKTIQRHIFNADLYMNDFLLYRLDQPVASGKESLDEFFYFYIHKCMWSTPVNVKTTAASIKKFYEFLAEQGIVDKAEYAEIADEIKESVPLWQTSCRDYNDELEEDIW